MNEISTLRSGVVINDTADLNYQLFKFEELDYDGTMREITHFTDEELAVAPTLLQAVANKILEYVAHNNIPVEDYMEYGMEIYSMGTDGIKSVWDSGDFDDLLKSAENEAVYLSVRTHTQRILEPYRAQLHVLTERNCTLADLNY